MVFQKKSIWVGIITQRYLRS